MKKSEFKSFLREEIKRKLSETTIVDKTTDVNKVDDIARSEKERS